VAITISAKSKDTHQYVLRYTHHFYWQTLLWFIKKEY